METQNKGPGENSSPNNQSNLISICYGIIITLALGLLIFGILNRKDNKPEKSTNKTGKALVILKEDAAPIKAGLYTSHPQNLDGKNLQLVRDLKEQNRSQSDKIIFLSQKISDLEEQLDDIKTDLFRKNPPENNFQLAKIFRENSEKDQKLEEFTVSINDLEQNLAKQQAALDTMLENLEIKNIETQETLQKLQHSSNELDAEKFFSQELKSTLESSALSQNENQKKIEKYEKAIVNNEDQIVELLAKIYDLSTSIEAQSAKTNDLEESIKTKTSQNESLQKQVEENENIIFKNLQEVALYKDKWVEQQEEIEDLKNKNIAYMDNAETEFLNQISSLDKDLREKQDDLYNLQIILEEQEQKIGGLYEQLNAASSDLEKEHIFSLEMKQALESSTVSAEEMRNNSDKYNHTIKENENQIREHLDKIYNLAFDIESQAAVTNDLKEMLKIKSKQNKSFKKQLEESSLRIQEEIKENAAYQERWAEQQLELDDLKNLNLTVSNGLETELLGQISFLENDLDEKERALEAQKNTLENKQQEIATLYEKLSEASNENSGNLDTYKKTIEANENQIGELLDRIYLLTSDIETNATKSNNFEEVIQTTTAENKALKKQLEESSTNIHQYIQEATVYRDTNSEQQKEIDDLKNQNISESNILEADQLLQICAMEKELCDKSNELITLEVALENNREEMANLYQKLSDSSRENSDNFEKDKQQINDLENQIVELLDRIYHLTSDIETTAAKSNNLEEILVSTSTQNESLKKQLGENTVNIHQYIQEAAAYRDTYSEQQKEIDELKAQNSSFAQDLETEIKALENELVDAKKTLESKQQELSALNEQFIETSNGENSRLENYKKTFEEKENQIEALQSEVSAHASDIASKTAIVNNLEEVIQTTATQNKVLKKQLKENVANIHKHFQEASTYKEKWAEQQTEIDDLKNQSNSYIQELETELLQQIGTLEKEMGAKEDEINNLQTAMQDQQQSIVDLYDQFKTAAKELKNEKISSQELKNALESAGAYQNEENNKVEKYKKALTDSENQITQLQDKISDITSNLEANADKSNDFKETAKTLQNQIDEKEETNQENLSEILKLQQALQDRSVELENMQNEQKELTQLINEKNEQTKCFDSTIAELEEHKSSLEQHIDLEKKRFLDLENESNNLKKENNSLFQYLEVEKNQAITLKNENKNIIQHNDKLESEIQEHQQNRQKMIEAINSKKREIENLNFDHQ